jgi:lipid-A-disaccharide synthase
MQTSNSKSVVMVAGEASGDMHGARVVRALKASHEQISICGVGGKSMASAGAKILIPHDQLSVVGITEAITKIPKLLKAMGQLKHLLASLNPDLLILIDFPDFNLHLAAVAKKLNIPVLYYISPQLWAWRPGRVKKIKARVDHMAVILPFETSFYEQHGVPVSFVGHPLMDSLTHNHDVTKKMALGKPVIGLLPGSRDREVNRLLPPMLDAAQILQNKIKGAQFIVSCAPSIEKAAILNMIGKITIDHLAISEAPISDVLQACDLVLAASGTVTLEAAIYTTPMIIIYSVSAISYLIAKLFVKVEHIGLANLIAKKRVVPEFVQSEVRPHIISDAAFALLTDSKAYLKMCQELDSVKRQLGAAGASARVAKIACTLMGCPHAL